MPSRTSSATINVQLTNFAVGHMQDQSATIADFLAPTIQVTGASGQYKVFDDANAFTVYNTERALGGDARRIEFNASDAYYNSKPNALEVTVDQAERDQAGNTPLANQLLDEGKVRALLNAKILSREKKIIDYVVANTTAVSQRGNWSDPDIDPIDQLDEQLDALSLAVGTTANIKLAIGVGAWRTLRYNPKVKARISGVQINNISLEQLRGLLMFPVEIKLGVLASNGVKPPLTGTKARLLGDHAILTYSVRSPTVYDPSGFKVFTVSAGYVAGVRTWRDPSDRFDVHAVDWSEDLKQTSTIATKRLAIT